MTNWPNEGVIIVVIIVAALMGSPTITQIWSQNETTQQQQAQYEAKLQYCYDLYADISDDFGWFFQAQKRIQYNQNCGELTGYISEKG